VFRDLEFRHGAMAPRGAQAVVITQAAEAEFLATQLTAQVPLHARQVVLFGSDMEGVDHHLGGLIRR
jgi:hypothetical protein